MKTRVGTTARAGFTVVVMAAVASIAALGVREVTTVPGSGSTAVTASAVAHVRTALDQLSVKGRAPMTGYSRDQFGQAWTDDNDAAGGHNKCDTRNDILAAQLTAIRKSGRCIVIAGTLLDPYTGRTITFTRGVGTSTDVQIDHVVSLGNAWASGAQRLTLTKRTELANDPDNLQATDGPTNEAKGDGDAATWLPPQRGYWCVYVSRQVGIKFRYNLSVTPAEHDRMAEILAGC